MRSLALALAALLAALVFEGALSGWPAARRERRGLRELDRATHGGTDEQVRAALEDLAKALARNPLSRDQRIAYETAVELALDRLGAGAVAASPMRGTLARSVVADALDRRHEWDLARGVRSAPGRASPEELALLDGPRLAALATASAEAHACEDAAPLLDKAVRETPNVLRLEMDRGTCLLETRQWWRAERVFAPMVASTPDSEWARFHLAESYVGLGDLHRAEEVSRFLVLGFPTFYYGWRQRGDLLSAREQYAEAAFAYRQALKLRPENRWLASVIRRIDGLARARKPAAHATIAAGPI